MPTDEECAYLAGMVDADGSVILRQQSSGSYSMEVVVYNVNEPLMRWLESTFGGHVRSEKRVKYSGWRIRWIWGAGGSHAREVLEWIEKYMHVKKPQALLAIEAWDNRNPRPRGERRYQPPDVDAIALRREYVDRMRNLNAVGGNGAKDVFEG